MVSIIIVILRVDEELRACVDSLAAHARFPYELILVNNGATAVEMPGCRVIDNGRNLGFARAVNRGIQAAQGDYVLLLNPDTCFIEDIISPMVDFMRGHPGAGITGVQLTFPDGGLQNSLDAIPDLANQLVNRSLLKRLFPKRYPSKYAGYTEALRVPSVIGACMLIRREVLEAIGGLDEGFFFYLEETDFCLRAAQHGFEVWHLPQLKLIHAQGTSARKRDVERTIEFQRSMLRFFRKHKGLPAWMVLLLFIMIKMCVELITNPPLPFWPKQKARFRRSAGVLAWILRGMPSDGGLESSAPDYVMIRRGGFRWFVAPGRELPGQEPARIMERFPDVLNKSRTTYVKRGLLDGRPVYLKRYNYKGPLDTVKNLFRPGRARHAFEAALLLENLGISTPAPLFACERRVAGVLLESYIATLGMEGRDLVTHVLEHGAKPEDIRRVAGFLRRLHEMGVVQTDLKGENVLIDSQGQPALIDLDRLCRRRYLSLERIARNLKYLNASFVELVSPELRRVFLDEYVKGHLFLEQHRDRLTRRIRVLTSERLRKRY